MKSKTQESYKFFFIILSIAILGIIIFYVVYHNSLNKDGSNSSLSSSNTDEEISNTGEIITQITTRETTADEAETEPENTDETQPVKSDSVITITESRITFTGTGDNVVHECLWMDAAKRIIPGGRAYNFKPMFDDIADMISKADIAFINQETLMAGSDFVLSGYPLFNSPQELGHDLVELGFDIINIATNHMNDKGEKGLTSTINFWRSLDTIVIGDYLNQDEIYDIKVIERGGIKIAFLSYTYGTNGITLPQSSSIVIPYMSDELFLAQIGKAKEISDAVIVSLHWGEENTFKPTASQRQFAQLIADHGVLAIIGHHPHVLQPIEWIEGTGGNKTLCVYSLGNLASGMIAPANMIGGFISFDIVKRDNTVTLETPVFTPTIYYYGHGWLDGHIYLLKDYTPELAKSHGTYTRHGYSDTIDTLWGYVTKNIAAEFLE